MPFGTGGFKIQAYFEYPTMVVNLHWLQFLIAFPTSRLGRMGGVALKSIHVYSLAVKISGTCRNQRTFFPSVHHFFLQGECKCMGGVVFFNSCVCQRFRHLRE